MSNEEINNVPLCGDFARGTCSRGSSCGFVHNINPNATQGAPLCRQFTQGQCSRPQTCRYLHNINLSERCLAALGQTARPGADRGQKRGYDALGGSGFEPMAKRMPEYLQQAEPLSYGAPPPLFSLPPFCPPAGPSNGAPPPQGDRRTQFFTLCRDYGKGVCTRDTCKFVHNSNKNSTREVLCGDFNRGKCSREVCKFVHNENKNAKISNQPPASDYGGVPPYQPQTAYPPLPPQAGFPSQAAFPPPPGYPPLPGYGAPPGAPPGMYGGAPPRALGPTLCFDFKRGKCTRDPADCKYIHDLNENSLRGAVECGDWKRGKCKRDKCKFVHDATVEQPEGDGGQPPATTSAA
jgi:hypothetical protein